MPLTEDHAAYLSDESRLVGSAESISFPENEADILAVLAEVRARGATLTVQGARTGITAGAVPHGGHVLNLSRMNRITGMGFDERSGAYVLHVQPGVTFAQVNKAIREKDIDTSAWSEASLQVYKQFRSAGEWFFAADITETTASLGGMASTNASGAKSFRYGAMREHVQGLRLVLPSGRLLTLERGDYAAEGRRFALRLDDGTILQGSLPAYTMPAVKNASGYFVRDNMDLVDLFIGSEGTLAIAAEIRIRLQPLPAVIWGVLAFFPNETRALDFVEALRELDLADLPAAIEYFDPECLELIRREKRSLNMHQGIPDIPKDYVCAVYGEFHQDDLAAMEAAIPRLATLLAACGGSEAAAWLGVTAQEMDKLITFRHAIPESVNRIIAERKRTHPGLTKLGTDMAVPDGDLRWVMQRYRQGIQQGGFESVMFGHIGNNHLHVNILPRNDEEFVRAKVLFLEWANAVIRAGGTISAEHGVGKLKTAFLTAMYGEEEIYKMRQLKRIFDPEGLLNPGNMFSKQQEQG